LESGEGLGRRSCGLVFGVWVFVLLVAVFGVVLNVPVVRASGTIYIRADGSIEGTDKIISSDNVTYTFTNNINDSIVVVRDNIVVDGAGYSLQGTGSGTGIYLSKRSNITIKNINIKNFLRGIALWDSSNNNTISGNDIKNSSSGIYLDSSSFNTITRNSIRNNTYGVDFWGQSNNNTIFGNDIVNNGKDLGPGYNPSGISILLGSLDNKIYHNNFVNNFEQVYVSSAQNVWDDGYPSGGNYWSDYRGIDANHDGIGDTPYVIYANIQDRYPLMNPWIPPSVGAKAGDWIKYTYTISGWPSGTPYPEWLKVEFLIVEGTTATVRVTMHMSEGTEQNATVPVDVVTGGQALGLSGFVIPANSTTGDIVYMSGYGNVTIAGETTRNYAGASRTIVYASFSQYGTQLTYYWDKQTGAMVEASTASGIMTATGRATETNIWKAAPGFPIDPIMLSVLIVIVIVIAFFLVRRKKKSIDVTTPEIGSHE